MDVFDLFAKLSLDSSEYEKGLSDAKKNASGFSEQFSKGTSQIKSGMKDVAVGVGIFTGLGTAAFSAANNVSQNLDEIDKMSQKLGLSKKAYQEWDYVLQISGADINNMSTGLKTLTNKFDEAVNGTASSVEVFERLGLSMEDIKDMSREDLFATVITQFQSMEDSAERAALANDLFGRSGQELAPLFNTTADETAELIKQVNELGGVMSDEAVTQGAQFQDSLTSLKTAFSGASNSLLTELLPVLTDLMDKISQFVADGGLDELISLLKTLAPVVATVVSAFAAFKIVTGVIGIVQGVSAVFTTLSAIVPMLTASFAPLLATIAPFIAIGAAIVGVGVLIYKNWDTIKEKAGELKDKVSEKWNELKENTSKKWEEMKANASEKWENMKNTISGVMNKLDEKTGGVLSSMAKAWQENGGGIQGTVAAWKAGVTTHFTNLFNTLNDATGGRLGELAGQFKEKFEEIKTKVKDTISDMVGSALTWGKDLIENFVNGIKDKIEKVKEVVSGVAQTVKDFLGFSEPEKGPLSRFHTFAPDMMDLFAKGITDNKKMLTDTVADAFDFEDLITDVGALSVDSGYNASRGGADISTAVMSALQGITVEVNIGTERLDGIVSKAIQRSNYRSGGR